MKFSKIAVISLLILIVGCTKQEKSWDLKPGKYIMQDSDLIDTAWVLIGEDGEFQFMRNLALSYLPIGTYNITGDELILYVNEDESYIFSIGKDKLIYESSNVDINDLIKKGTIFELSETTGEPSTSVDPSVLETNSNNTNSSINLTDNIENNDLVPIEISDPNEQQTDKIKNKEITDFALKLLYESYEEDKNILISPLSIVSALGMVANGAEGNTLSEMELVLNSDLQSLNDYLFAFNKYLPSSKNYKVSLANSIWFKDKEALTINQDFLQDTRDYYDASVYKAPFDENTKKDINSWVEDKTDGMIDRVLDQAPPESAVMYLINALSFDAEWEIIYNKDRISDGEFTLEDGQKKEAEFMSSSEYSYLENESVTGFIKPYKDNQYAFVALLPKENISMSELLKSLDVSAVMGLLENKEKEEVFTKIPKFSVEYETLLNESLQTLGIEDAFDYEKADFTGLGSSTDGNIFISRVIHKTIIDVDEKGTRAGAVTAVEMVEESAMVKEPKVIVLDRPFFYMIIDTEQYIPLFMGSLMTVD